MGRDQVLMQGAIRDAGYYRQNPSDFVRDYLHISLRLFQKLLLIMMFWATEFVFVACRGLGKTYLTAIFCVTRCILYPGTKICIASGTRGQSVNVLEKIILELKPQSRELALEIDEKMTKLQSTQAQVVFKNGSFIKVVTASDSARGNRANILLVDEYRMVSKDVIDTILTKFLTNPRIPPYMNKPEYKGSPREVNKTLYLSSAFYGDHWSYQKANGDFNNMVDGRGKYFVCGFPYEVAIEEGLLMKETVESQMLDEGFNEITWSIEMNAEFYLGTDGSFFEWNSVAKNRHIKYPWLPDKVASLVGNNQKVRVPPKMNGEKRILSADIALMASKKHNNDATAIFVNQMVPTKAGKYTHNIVYTDSMEGLRTEDQALRIRKLYDEYQCDYIVLDTNGRNALLHSDV